MKRKSFMKPFAATLLMTAMVVGISGAASASGVRDAPKTGEAYALVTGDVSDVPKGGKVVDSYEDMHLVAFANEEKALKACEKSKDVSPNTPFTIAEDEAVGEDGIERETLPFESLENELDGAKKPKKAKSGKPLIALIDTGVPKDADVEGTASMLGGDGVDEHGHGTAMLEAIRENDPDARILSIQAMDKNGRGDAASVCAAVEYARQMGANIINLSVTGKAASGNQAVEDVIRKATDEGILVICAAGNDGANVSNYIPGRMDEVVTVGACDTSGKRLASSNYGKALNYTVVADSTSRAAARLTGDVSFYNGSLEKAINGVSSHLIFLPDETIAAENEPIDHEAPEGFEVAWNEVGGMNLATSDYLMENIQMHLQDKMVPLSVSFSGFNWWYSDNDMAPFWCLRSTRPGGRAYAGDWASFRYAGSATYNGQPVDVSVRFTFGDSSDQSESGDGSTQGYTNHTIIRPMENLKPWTDRTQANLSEGFVYCHGMNVTLSYTFYYAGTNNVVPINTCYFTFGSLNLLEGLRPYDHNSVTYYKVPGAYPQVIHLNAWEEYSIFDPIAGFAIHGKERLGQSADWVLNHQSNAFADTYRDSGSDFWKSVMTMKVTDTDHVFNFYLKPSYFWLNPNHTTVGAVADPPKKYVMNGSTRATSVHKHSGDTVTFELEQCSEVLAYTGNGMTKYSNFSFTDTLPAGLSYTGAKVVRRMPSGEVDVTNKGTLTYNASTRTVNFAFSSNYLQNEMPYVGEAYVLVINTTLGSASASRTLTNSGYTTICNTRQDTNSVTVSQTYYLARTQIRYRDVNGNWGGYSERDSRLVEPGDTYSYTWTRNAGEPANVYYDAYPTTVSQSNIQSNVTLSMDVERKKYTYSFNANPPSGHGASEIGNMQPGKVDWWAETMSGGASSPSLTGHTFLGWNTSTNGAGGAYANEKMLSNKTFYALWRANQYHVKYDPNGGSNPDHLEGEFTQNAVLGTMERSTYQYDVTGALRPNAFAREGYEFVGWNTRADGTGTAYPDGYSNVLNWTSADGGEITLYAQWRKKLGNETLTVVSEETGNPVPGVHLKLYKKVNGAWTEVPGVGERVTDENGQTSVSGLHWFDYEWRSVSVPDGYQGMTNVNYQITYNHLSRDDVRILYMRHVSLVLDSTVSDVIKGEDAPAFLYHVSGTDVAGVRHEYDVLVRTGSNKKGTNSVSDMFAGTYDITQLPVSRYVPGNAKNVSGATPNGINAKADLRNAASAEVLFPYTIRQYSGFASVDAADNAVKK